MTAPPDELDVPTRAPTGGDLSVKFLAGHDDDEITALWSDLTINDVPLFVATLSADPDPRKEFDRPPGWQHLTADGNPERLAYRPGYAVMAVTGGALVVIDVDPRHGGDVDAVRERLLGLGVRIFAEIETPGGGMHFYVAGHPEIASGSRLPGWPGVDVQSFGRNVFVPGTSRPKYGGRGYRVVHNDLAALADGGDPDGADVLAGVLAVALANRHTTGEPAGEAAPPWDGTPMTDRVRRYLDGAVKLSAERLSKVTSGGRNHALNGEVYALARLAAATGYPLDGIREPMVTACTTNGLVADDGLRSVHATIGSAIRAGRSRPRAVPEPTGLAATIAARSAQLRASGGTAGESAEPVTDEAIAAAEEEFWSSRPELDHLRRFARARMVAPWALLGCVLLRVLATVPPWVVLPPLVGSDASLNSFLGLVGPSGSGKDGALDASADAVDIGGAMPIYTVSPGSGEGLVHQYRKYVKDDPAGEIIRDAVLFVAGEVDTLATLGQRAGSTLLYQLRAAWTGSTLGHAYVDQTKAVRLPAHSYRLCLVVGIQPGRAAPLLDDADGGTPQRFLWLPATDPQAPDIDQLPADPGPWKVADQYWTSTATEVDRTGGRLVLPVPEPVSTEIRQARQARLRGALDDDRYGGHLRLACLKVAQALAFLGGRRSMTIEDWDLAKVVIDMSEVTRESVKAELSTKATNAAMTRGRLDGAAQVAAAAVVDEAVDAKVETQIQRVCGRIRAALEDGPLNRAELRTGKVRSTDRPVFDEAVDRLISAGQVVLTDGKYRLVR